MQQLGNFEVLGEIGRGGMGVVFKARQKSLDRIVALKLLRADGTDDERRRFDREAQAVARLQHANIVQVYEVGEIASQAFVFLEFVDGQGSAAAWIVHRCRASRQAAAALVEIFVLRASALCPRTGNHPPRSEASEHFAGRDV